ncbi:MAG TPA: DUF6364 family protein [Phnomibacter sp.]|nr:DUF6364 family protein [Phnomibacter sp.]
MDAKVTLSFNADVIESAKQLADDLDISLSRLTEILLQKALEHGRPVSIEELPISTWVQAVAEDSATYITKAKSRAQLKKEFFEGRR